MKELDLTGDEKVAIAKYRFEIGDKREMLWGYSIYVLPSLIFIALSLRSYSFELCFYAYLVLLISFVYLLHWSYRNDCVERSIMQKFIKHHYDDVADACGTTGKPS